MAEMSDRTAIWVKLLWFYLCVSFTCIHTTLASRFSFNIHNTSDGFAVSTNLFKGESVSVTAVDGVFHKLLDDNTTKLLVVVQYCIISTSICIFGIITNIINIRVFIKQGFDESVNISLFGLAISDLSSLITLLWLNLCFSPFLQLSQVPFLPDDVAYLTAGWPRVAFSRITAWITAFITFERCLCITMPLKVKMIITPRRTCIVIISTFVLLTASIYPTYYTSRLVWKFCPERNQTLLGLSFTVDRQAIDSVMFALNNAVLPSLAFVVVLICTIILGVKLNEKLKWREKSSKRSEQLATKDRKIVKLVSLISIIFIICFFPNAIIFSAMAYEPEFNIDGRYRNMFIIAFSYCFILESINSSINILLYLKMSTKYRDAFNQVFNRCCAIRH